jgi:hypothetical protein
MTLSRRDREGDDKQQSGKVLKHKADDVGDHRVCAY